MVLYTKCILSVCRTIFIAFLLAARSSTYPYTRIDRGSAKGKMPPVEVYLHALRVCKWFDLQLYNNEIVEIFISVEVCIIIHRVIMVYQHSLMTPATGCSCLHIIGLKCNAVNELPLDDM